MGANFNHDALPQLLRRDIADKPLPALIGRYLRAGVLVGERLQPSAVGTPQGGPLGVGNSWRPDCHQAGGRARHSSASKP